uniref:HMA domain-containing protein n=1 Tax=Heterorhabditis bacteriophora TaxID=37862 RepID=A0A1I7WRL8_HETBA
MLGKDSYCSGKYGAKWIEKITNIFRGHVVLDVDLLSQRITLVGSPQNVKRAKSKIMIFVNENVHNFFCESQADIYAHLVDKHNGVGGGWRIENNVVVEAPLEENDALILAELHARFNIHEVKDIPYVNQSGLITSRITRFPYCQLISLFHYSVYYYNPMQWFLRFKWMMAQPAEYIRIGEVGADVDRDIGGRG